MSKPSTSGEEQCLSYGMHLTSLQLKTRFEQCSGLYYAQQADEHGHEASMGILCPCASTEDLKCNMVFTGL